MAPEDDLALRIVVAEGILSSSEARALGDEAARAGQGVLERLQGEGKISEPTFASLRARVLEQAATPPRGAATLRLRPPGAAAPGAGPDEADPASRPAHDPDDPDAFPVPGWDRYEPIRLLGQGGMGRVFLARDLRLDRHVAIKFVRGDDPELARRIVAEARAQARVNDGRVCKVYDVGEVRRRVYIAMQFIDGKPLSELAGELTVEQQAIAIRGAALGVSEAHRVGLIHRDLKPSNILVERAPDGELRPFVMDFGLARDWTESATMTGTVLGTPQYMAPEQARGEVSRLDRRADVYSLGATLYVLLTGEPPVAGSNPLEVLTRVSTVEPVRPRELDPDVPADLEAIVMKCLEKERGARYDSARALADDLGRFLDGQPVEARSAAGLGYRLRKLARRHARLVAGIAAVLVVIAFALGFALRERQRSARRETLARRFTEQVERIESMARYASLAPLHDLRPDRARLRRAMDELAAEVRAGGDLAAAPGYYALGRGHLALGDDERAASDLAAAWARGFREPRVAYSLALAEGHLYQRGLREVERLSDELPASLRAERRREVERRHREPALRYLRASTGAGVSSPAYVAALIALHEGRFDDALGHLDAIDRAGDARPWFYEAPLLRGEVLRARAKARFDRGDAAAAADDLAAGRRALDAAAAIGESEPAVYTARAQLEETALGMQQYASGAVDAPFAQGLGALARGLSLVPDDASALALRAGLLRGLADHRSRRGEDVTELLTRAVDDARRAVELAPARREGRLALASIYRQWGQARQGRHQDPSEPLGRAVELLDAFAAADRDAEFFLDLGLVHTVWADYQDGLGQDSSAHRRQAIDAYARAVRIAGNHASAWLNLGTNYVRRASLPDSPDADGDLARALEALSRGRALDPENFATYSYEGDVYSLVAQRREARGDDPGPDRARALELYRQGSAMSPGEPALHNAIAGELIREAGTARAAGRDPRALLEQAEAAAREAVRVAPDQGFGYSNIGDALAARAAHQHAQREDPIPAATAAEAAFKDALARLPEHPTIWLNLATLHAFVARVELDRRRDPRPRAAAAGAAIDRALAISPSQPEAERLREETRALVGRWQAGATSSR